MEDNEVDYESCIICGVITDIPVTLNIDYRLHYIEGAGQLCQTCFHKLTHD